MRADLEKAIKKAAIDGTLTEEAIEHFKTLTEEHGNYKRKAEHWEKEAQSLRRENDGLRSEARRANEEVEKWKKREGELKDRESAMLRLELGCQSAGDRLMDMKEVMRLVFGNRVVRETAIHSGMEDQS